MKNDLKCILEMCIFFKRFTPFCRCGRSWKKGRGSASKARIGPRRKLYGQGKKREQEKAVSPTGWPITIPCGWIKVPHDTELRLCQISWPDLPNVSPPVVICSLNVNTDFS